MKLKKFKFAGKDFAFTDIFDSVERYDFGHKYYVYGAMVSDSTKRQYWHRIALGFYRRSDSWVR